MTNGVKQFIEEHFGVTPEVFLQALRSSPSANGYIMGAISEMLLKQHLESLGYEVHRIKEKPSGGNNAKNEEARGDFYIRKRGKEENKWLVIECKGLKSNSEFRGSKLDNKEKLFKYLKPLAFPPQNAKQDTYNKGLKTYKAAKEKWEAKNPNQNFPQFGWNTITPGAFSVSLLGLWANEQELKDWINSQPDYVFTEEAYRNVEGAISILETHQPSTRVSEVTKNKQAAPLVKDFNIMAVDLFLRTGKHEYAFMNAEKISHSPSSPEHLYQNYTIDILVKDKKVVPVFTAPWYGDIELLITQTNPIERELDETQLDKRESSEEDFEGNFEE